MPNRSGLSQYSVIAFVPIVDVEKARSFYRDTLGLKLLSEEPPYALVFDAKGIMLRLTIMAERKPLQATVLGWQVPDITLAVKELEQSGVTFERYQFLPQNAEGVWTAPTGARVAWFKDPDGNILSLSEHPELEP